jgi:hypothetical protein
MGVLEVLVILAVLVAVVRAAVQERDDERVFEPDRERVRRPSLRTRAGHQLVAQQRPAARAVDQDISRLRWIEDRLDALFVDAIGAVAATEPATRYDASWTIRVRV